MSLDDHSIRTEAILRYLVINLFFFFLFLLKNIHSETKHNSYALELYRHSDLSMSTNGLSSWQMSLKGNNAVKRRYRTEIQGSNITCW